jgi:hypothetical protein
MAEKKRSATKKPSARASEAKAVDEGSEAQGEPRDPEQIESEIEQTREDLGETVAALADKTDVKKQAKRKVEETKAAAQAKASETADAAKQTLHDAPRSAEQARDRALAAIRENPVHAATAAAIGLVALAVLIRRSRR